MRKILVFFTLLFFVFISSQKKKADGFIAVMNSPADEGTGLELSLTYDMVVKGHGGSIDVNSKEYEGSKFIIQLPYHT